MTSRVTQRESITVIVNKDATIKQVDRESVTNVVRREVITKIVREVVNGNSN